MKKDLIKQEELVEELYKLVQAHQDKDKCTCESVSVIDKSTTMINLSAMNDAVKNILSIFNREVTQVQ